jgi:hypothetical protein
LQGRILSNKIIELFVPWPHFVDLSLEHGDLLLKLLDMLLCSLADRPLSLSIIGPLSLQLFGRERGDLSRSRARLPPFGWSSFLATTHDPSGFGDPSTCFLIMNDSRVLCEPVLSH